MEAIEQARQGSVRNVLDVVREHERPLLPERLIDRERGNLINPTESAARLLADLDALLEVPYVEIERFASFRAKHSPFATKHGVKGAEFDDVLVVASRGWNQYDWNKMLELRAPGTRVPAKEQASLQRNLNLFYVACSRARERLVVLFTQELSDEALQTLGGWFGDTNVHALPSP